MIPITLIPHFYICNTRLCVRFPEGIDLWQSIEEITTLHERFLLIEETDVFIDVDSQMFFGCEKPGGTLVETPIVR